MPSTINGIGTWYYGKKNLIKTAGFCENCGRDVTFSAYDTTKYFVFFFIPLFCLKRVRVFNSCPVCHAHKFIDLNDWEGEKIKMVGEAAMYHQENPERVEDAARLLEMLDTYEEHERFFEMAPVICSAFPDSVPVQLTAARGYYHFGALESCEECLKRCLKYDDDNGTREFLAEVLIHLRRPADAVPYVQHIIDADISDRIYFLLLLAEAFMVNNNKVNCDKYLNHALEIAPEIAAFTIVKRLKKQVKSGGAGKFKSARVGKKTVIVANNDSFMSDILVRFSGMIVLFSIITGLLIGSVFYKNNRTVFLINGLEQKYEVRVGDNVYTLRPGMPLAIKVKEGTTDVVCLDDSLGIEPQHFTIAFKPILRLFDTTTFVVNPDRLVFLGKNTVYYSGDVTNLPDSSCVNYFGSLFYRFQDIDLPFEVFPQTVPISSTYSVVGKTQIDYGDYDKEDVYYVLKDISEHDKNRVVSFVKSYLKYYPDNVYLWSFISDALSQEELLEFTNQVWSMEIDNIFWHRMYQNAYWRLHSENTNELMLKYKAYLAEDSTSKERQYLYGRVLGDVESASALMEKAGTGDNPCFHANEVLVRTNLNKGLFSKALDVMSLETKNNIMTGELYYDVLLANNKFYEAAALAAKKYEGYLYEFEWREKHLNVFGCRNDYQGSLKIINKWEKEFKSELGKRDAGKLVIYYKLINNMLFGKFEQCRKDVRDSDIIIRYHLALFDGDWKTAEDIWSKSDDTLMDADRYFYLQQQLLASLKRKADNKAVDSAGELINLYKADFWEKYKAEVLVRDDVTINELAYNCDDVRDMVLMLEICAYKQPDDAESFRSLAAKLNFSRIVPHYLLKQAY